MEEPLDDHSFEEFLKGRLENIEADPAADAWDKIFGEISQDVPAPVQKKPWFVRKLWILAACMLWFVPQDTHHIVVQHNSSPTIAQSQGKYVAANVKQKTSDTKNRQQAQIIGNPLVENRQKPLTKKSGLKPHKSVIITTDKHKKKGYKRLVSNNKKIQHQTKPSQKILGHTPIRHKATVQPNATKPTKKQQAKVTSGGRFTHKSNPMVAPKVVMAPAPSKNKRTRLQVPLITPRDVSELAFAPHKHTDLQKVPIPKQKNKTPRGLLVKAFVAPNYNAYRLVTNKEDNEVIQNLSKNEVFSNNNLGFSGGVMLESHLSRRWSVIWGLSYTQLNSQVRYNSTNALPDSIAINVINKSQVEVTPIYSTETKNYQYKYQDIGVQLGVNYLLFGKGWQHQLYLGAAANRVTNTITQTQNEVVKESSSQIQPMINVGYDMRIPLGKRVGFYLKPTFNYYLNAINQANTAYEVKPFFTSLRLGLVWKLK